MSKQKIEQSIFGTYQLRRSTADFLAWVEVSFQSTKPLSAMEFKKSKIIKKLREEAHPIGIVLSRIDYKGEIQLNLGNEHFDAKVFENGIEKYIEVGCVKNGHLEQFVFLHMEKYGRAPASGVTVEDFKNALINNSELFPEVVDPRLSVLSLIKTTNDLICSKNKIAYHPETTLVLSVDGPFNSKNGYWDEFVSSLSTAISRNRFEKIYVVGHSEAFFSEVGGDRSSGPL